jgi:hypothetical protein
MEYVIQQDFILVMRNAQDFRGAGETKSRRLARCSRRARRPDLPRFSGRAGSTRSTRSRRHALRIKAERIVPRDGHVGR